MAGTAKGVNAARSGSSRSVSLVSSYGGEERGMPSEKRIYHPFHGNQRREGEGRVDIPVRALMLERPGF